MANTLQEIISTLASVKVAITVAQAVGLSIPPALANYESEALQALSAVQNFEAPNSLTNDIADVQALATGLSTIVSVPSLSGILTALTKIKSVDSDLTSGQLAIIGIVGASFDGTADKVVFAAYRESGDFAKMVDSATTDTSVTG